MPHGDEGKFTYDHFGGFYWRAGCFIVLKANLPVNTFRTTQVNGTKSYQNILTYCTCKCFIMARLVDPEPILRTLRMRQECFLETTMQDIMTHTSRSSSWSTCHVLGIKPKNLDFETFLEWVCLSLCCLKFAFTSKY